MLSWLFAAALAATPPVIAAPTGAIILPAASTALTGISVSLVGSNATTQFTMTFACTGCTFTATGTNVSGSGTASLSIGPDVSLTLNAALATLHIVWPTAVLQAQDTVTINASSGGTNATPAVMVIVVDGTKYLPQTTPAAALTRSQTQCSAIPHPCDGVKTKYWWNVVTLTDGTGAVQTIPGDACQDVTTTKGCSGATGTGGTGLSGAEQSALVGATSVALPLPGSAAALSVGLP